jgi:hypothetical protein
MCDYDQVTEDPCRAGSTFSGPRFLAFTLLFVVMLGGGPILLFMRAHTPYGIQLASAVSYTAAVMLYGFAKNQMGIQPYLFTCPVVESQYPHLLKRHVAFLAALVAFETVLLRIKPYLPVWWLTSSGRNMPPFFIALALPCGVLLIVEIMTNRGLLERAHNDRFGEPPAPDEPKTDGTFSLFGGNQ